MTLKLIHDFNKNITISGGSLLLVDWFWAIKQQERKFGFSLNPGTATFFFFLTEETKCDIFKDFTITLIYVEMIEITVKKLQ